jgi:hypothetical protein
MAMTLANPSSPLSGHRAEMTPGSALRIAWVSYVIFAFLPFFLFVGVIVHAMNSTTPVVDPLAFGSTAAKWCIGSLTYLAIGVPCAIFWRSHLFRAYWRGQRVAPSAYLHGMVAVWVALEIGGLLSLVGCLVSDSVMPGLLPAAVAGVLFAPFYPNGRAMVTTQGHSDDPESYQEPR